MLTIDKRQYDHLRALPWEEVFDIWRRNEADNLDWIKHYQQRGFSSWEEWRQATHGPINGSEREWHLYKVINPATVVPTFRAGPFKSWKRLYFEGKESPQFADLVNHPGLQRHDGLERMITNFPPETTITGLLSGGDIYVIEGMHRCCAITLAAQRGQALATELTIALAEYSQSTLPELGTDKKK